MFFSFLPLVTNSPFTASILVNTEDEDKVKRTCSNMLSARKPEGTARERKLDLSCNIGQECCVDLGHPVQPGVSGLCYFWFLINEAWRSENMLEGL